MKKETTLVEPQVITLETQKIVVSGFNADTLLIAAQSLKKEAEVVDGNLSMKNWDTSKKVEFERCVFLGCDMIPTQGTESEPEKMLETAFFMDADFNIWYKAAYQFVKAVRMLQVGANFTAKFVGVEKISNGNKAECFEIRQLRLI